MRFADISNKKEKALGYGQPASAGRLVRFPMDSTSEKITTFSSELVLGPDGVRVTLSVLCALFGGILIYCASLFAEGYSAAVAERTLHQLIQNSPHANTVLASQQAVRLRKETYQKLSRLAELERLLGEGKLRLMAAELRKASFGQSTTEKELIRVLEQSIQTQTQLEHAAENKNQAQYQLKSTQEKFNLLRTQFATLLEYHSPVTADAGSAEHAVVLYAFGVFAGLPLIAGLPDNLTEEQLAAHQINRQIISKLRQARTNPAHPLAIELAHLRQESQNVRNEQKAAHLQRAQAEQMHSELGEHIARQHVFAASRLRDLMSDAAKPTLRPGAFLVYSAAQRRASRLGWALPPLLG